MAFVSEQPLESGRRHTDFCSVAYEKVRNTKDETTWLLCDYEVGPELYHCIGDVGAKI